MKLARTVAVTNVLTPVQLYVPAAGETTNPIPIAITGSAANWRVAYSNATLPAAGVGGDFFTAGGVNSSLEIVADPSQLWVANSSGTISFIVRN